MINSNDRGQALCSVYSDVESLIQTPDPNLARGMQHWLSGYANWYAKRNQRSGHLYQGRYKAFVVEDAGYYWTLSRYIHLNPCNGGKPLAADPVSWQHSSFAGYARKSKRVDWVQYDLLHTYWNRHRSTTRRTKSVSIEEIISATAATHGVDQAEYAMFRSGAAGRDMAAWLCRRWSGATLKELGAWFGVEGTDSVSNLARRAETRYNESPKWRRQAKEIEANLGLNTEHKA